MFYEDISNLGFAYSKITKEAEKIKSLPLGKCEALGEALMGKEQKAEFIFLHRNVTVYHQKFGACDLDYSSHTISTVNPSIIRYILERVGNALRGTVLETNPSRFAPFVGILLSGVTLGISDIEGTTEKEDAKIFLKENLCFLFAEFVKNEITFQMDRQVLPAHGEVN